VTPPQVHADSCAPRVRLAAPGHRARGGLMAAVCAMRGLEELDLRQHPSKEWSTSSLGELAHLIDVVRRPRQPRGLPLLRVLLIDEVEGPPY